MVVSKDRARHGFAERFNKALRIAGAPEGRQLRSWVANKYGVSIETARKWLTGIAVPDQARMLAIAGGLDDLVSPDWLLTGKGAAPGSGNDAVKVANDEIPAGYIRLPQLTMVASMGFDGYFEEVSEVVQYLDVAEWWAKQNLPSNVKRIKIISARGDSNAGLINHGDIIFVDVSVDHFQGEGLYVFNWNGHPMIKRLAPDILRNELMIVSHNPAYPPQMIPSTQLDQLHIAGRVVAWWTLRKH